VNTPTATTLSTWSPATESLPSPGELDRLGLGTFTAIDLETTGLDSDMDRIIEWGAVRFRGGRLDATFRTFIAPERPLPEEIVQLTGITDEHLDGAPDFEEAHGKFMDFWEPSAVVGHNVEFDLDFLKASWRRMSFDHPPAPFQRSSIHDTSQLSRILMPSETGYGLGSLVRSQKIHHQEAHRALADATATGWLFLMLVKEALELDFQIVQTQLRFIEGGRTHLNRFLAKLGNVLAQREIEKPIRRATLVAEPEKGEDIERPELPKQSPGWKESDYGRLFSRGGEISRALDGFEERPQQAEMAMAVHRAFRDRKFLCVEAGTGTGKSLAYLAPALAWATAKLGERRRVIISTGTKNLQEQLCNKDLPDLIGALPFQFRTALLKGRSNYLCLSRWKNVLMDPAFRLIPEERLAALPLVKWLAETETGDLSEVSALRGPLALSLASKLASDPGVCSGQSCKEFRRCFLQRARRKAQQAHAVVVNHALLFADITNEGSVLGDYNRLIVDEAHKLEKSAVSHLGIEWSDAILRRPLNRLYQGGRVERGILSLVKEKLGKPSDPPLIEFKNQVRALIDQITLLEDTGREFLQRFLKLAEPLPPDNSGLSNKKRYKRGQHPWDSVGDETEEVLGCYQRVIRLLATMLDSRDEVEGKFPYYSEEIAGEFRSARDDLTRDRDNFQFLVKLDDPNWVGWYEISGSAERRWLKFQAAPLDVSSAIYEALWKRLGTGILTSATLAVGKSFRHLLDTVGLDRVPEERVERLRLDSPFELDRQMAILVPGYFPSPKFAEHHLEAVSGIVEQVAETHRGTLVLFTSYQALNQVAAMIKPTLEKRGITLLVQGKHGSPELLLKRFREERSSILFGTDSFWEGIDVVGEALQILIVTKLPFDVPTEPWIEARHEQITSRGGNAFMEFSVPEAVIRLRQGVGRLIRTRSDRGVVLVTDSRMVRTRFGQVFVDALPTITHTMKEPGQLMDRFNRFWRE
jgi:predicted DnaQ family exonuclease/DinG family helicase